VCCNLLAFIQYSNLSGPALIAASVILRNKVVPCIKELLIWSGLKNDFIRLTGLYPTTADQ
jgi:hypothetical protein